MVSPLIKQLYFYFGMASTNFVYGYIIGLLSIMVPILRKNSHIQLTAEQESWIPATLFLTGFPAQFLSGLSTKRVGRKLLITISLMFSISACILYFLGQSFTELLLASMLGGCTSGGMAISTMMLAETVSPKLRGLFLYSKNSLALLGMSTTHILGNYLNWRILAIIGVIPSVLGLLISITVPESPALLASRGNFMECASSFKWYRGDEGEDELQELITAQRKNISDKIIESNNQQSKFSRFCKFITDKGFLKATGISIASVLLIESTGKQIFSMFAVDLITKISGDETINPYTWAMAFDFVDILGFIISCVSIKTFTRRTLLFATGVPGGIFLFLFCLLSYLGVEGIIVNRPWISFVTIGLYFLLISIGVIPVAVTLMGEIFPLSHRGEGVAITSFIFVTLLFVIAKFSPTIIREFDIYGTFLIHAMFLTVSLIYLYFYVPETDFKTLQRIEDEIKGRIKDNERNISELEPFQLPISQIHNVT